MKFPSLRGALCLLFLGAAAPFAAAQDLVGQLQNDVRNTFSQQPAAQYPPSSSEPSTGSQFRATSAIGGWIGTRIVNGGGTLLAGPQVDPVVEGATTLKLPADTNGLQLQSVRMGRGLMVRKPDAYIGDVIPPPNVDDAGNEVDGFLAYYPKPHKTGDFHIPAVLVQAFASRLLYISHSR